jgi:CubicO group peptidase (beta-lactamase class C family)
MKTYILILALTGLSLNSFAQRSNISSRIKENIKARVDAGENISIAIGYFEGDRIEYFNYGKTAIVNGLAVDENTVYEIGNYNTTGR